ncbi:MAG TPA: SDR family oxidoreductase [Stellaceae bacterium]|jgi:NAD(P)-dependent dehydrogenase (short-subunit alcohol dehydrogenase family)|nr:SDR family oxidoreductase [Stellaceae bacterium]
MKTILLTGASRGLGLEFARQYAEAGWRVIATCRDPKGADKLRGVAGKVEIHPLDATDFPAIAALAQKLDDVAIDILLANAGIIGPRDMPADAIDEAQWAEVFRVNAMAPLALAGAFRRHVERSSERKAIAISSRLGSMAANDSGGLYVYRSSKAALNAVWRSFAIDNKGLIAAVLHPGWVSTDMGGSSAPVTPQQSVTGMRKVISGLTPAESGAFFGFDGEALPW